MTDNNILAEFSSLLSGSSSVLIGNLGSKLLQFVVFVAIVRFLSIEHYGGLAIGLTILSIGSVISQLGLNQGIQRYVPQKQEMMVKTQIIQTSLILVSGWALVVAAVVIVFAGPLAGVAFNSPELKPVIRILALSIPLSAVLNLGISSTRSLEYTWPKVILHDLLQPLLRFTFITIVIILGFGVIEVALAYFFSFLIIVLSLLLFIYRIFQNTLNKLPNSILDISELIKYSLPLFGAGILSMVTGEIDMILLGILADPASVGSFRVIYTMSRNFLIVFGSFQFLFTPMFSRLSNDDAFDLANFYERATRWGFYPTICVLAFVFIFTEPLLKILFKAEYIFVANELRLLTLYGGVVAFLGFNRAALLSLGYSRVQFIDTAILAITNFSIDLALIPKYGVLGAVIGTITASIVVQILYSFQLYRRTGIHGLSVQLAIPGVYLMIGMIVIHRLGIESKAIDVRIFIFIIFIIILFILVISIKGIQKEDIRIGKKALRETF